jgi:hypothetical protein
MDSHALRLGIRVRAIQEGMIAQRKLYGRRRPALRGRARYYRRGQTIATIPCALRKAPIPLPL